MPLTKKTPIETWIDDFVNSDNPKFAGKSKEKRRQMAIAAYYGAKNESVTHDLGGYETGATKHSVELLKQEEPKYFKGTNVTVHPHVNDSYHHLVIDHDTHHVATVQHDPKGKEMPEIQVPTWNMGKKDREKYYNDKIRIYAPFKLKEENEYVEESNDFGDDGLHTRSIINSMYNEGSEEEDDDMDDSLRYIRNKISKLPTNTHKRAATEHLDNMLDHASRAADASQTNGEGQEEHQDKAEHHRNELHKILSSKGNVMTEEQLTESTSGTISYEHNGKIHTNYIHFGGDVDPKDLNTHFNSLEDAKKIVHGPSIRYIKGNEVGKYDDEGNVSRTFKIGKQIHHDMNNIHSYNHADVHLHFVPGAGWTKQKLYGKNTKASFTRESVQTLLTQISEGKEEAGETFHFILSEKITEKLSQLRERIADKHFNNLEEDIRRVQGKSYGNNFKTDEDGNEVDTTEVKPKQGRGRPKSDETIQAERGNERAQALADNPFVPKPINNLKSPTLLKRKTVKFDLDKGDDGTGKE